MTLCGWCGGYVLGDDADVYAHIELHALDGDVVALAFVLDPWASAEARCALAMRELS